MIARAGRACLSKCRQGRVYFWRARRRRHPVRSWKAIRALPDGGRLVWITSRCSEVWLRALLHEPESSRLDKHTQGWEIGTGPSVVLVDKGMARSFTTDTMHSGIYAFTFDQRGLMAGLGVQGSKITRID